MPFFGDRSSTPLNGYKLRTLPITKININIPSYIIPDDITPDFQWFILKGNNGGIELWHL
jgi:hypothetical protein